MGSCIRQVQVGAKEAGIDMEIIVADNGSIDRSAEIAAAMGCKIVHVADRGYGAALRGGILAAQGEYVIFADSDDTYLYHDAPRLLAIAKESCAGMAIASRMTGRIEKGAMPFLHQHLGTPVLTRLINRLFTGKLTDCNSGFRCVRKAEYEGWNVRSNGMEFASELLIKALKSGTKIVEIPSGLRCGPPDRLAHLRTWRDGMRHLLFILSEKPALFERLGLFMLVPATLLQCICTLMGPIRLLGMNIFDIHSQALLLMTALFGTQFYVFGCTLFLSSKDKPLRLTKRLIEMDEGNLFFGMISVLGASLLVILGLIGTWIASNFGGLHQANQLLAAVHFLGVAAMSVIGLLSVHTLKKSQCGQSAPTPS